jgi:hypothetical protein
MIRPDNIPILLLLVSVAAACWWALKRGLRNDRQGYLTEAKESDRVQVWPHLVRVEFLAAIGVLLLLVVWSILVDAPLEDPANPAVTPNPTKAPWYFVGLQEMLVYFDPWIAGVVIPTIIVLGLMAIPYIDPGSDGGGFYTILRRKKSLLIFAAGFVGLWILFIVIGSFFRGPGWNFVVPWEPWDTHQVAAIVNRDFTEKFFGIPTWYANHRLNPVASLLGGLVLVFYFSIIPLIWFLRRSTSIMKRLGFGRYIVVSFLLLLMFSIPIKVILRVLFDVKYVWVTPWFNI